MHRRINETVKYNFSRRFYAVLFFVISVFSLSFTITQSVFAAYPATKFAPGETLNPSCGPTDVNCGVEQIYVSTSTQNYGIGTNTPNTKLQVVGEINATNFTTSSSTAISTFGNISITNSTTVNATSTSLFATVARFTTSVFDAFSSALATITGGTINGTTIGAITPSTGAFTSLSNSGGYTQSGTTANAFTGTPTFSNSTFSALFMGGNVGIGTTTPAAILAIQETGTTGIQYVGNLAASTLNIVARSGVSRQINFNVGGTSAAWGGVINISNPYVLASSTAQIGIWNRGDDFSNSANLMTQINTDGSGELTLRKFGTAATGNLNINNNDIVALSVTNAGNIGIGTTTPKSKLAMGNNVYTAPLDAYSKYQVLLYDSGLGATSYGIGIEPAHMGFNAGAGYKFYRGGGATPDMVITGGNVGIGTTTPAYGFVNANRISETTGLIPGLVLSDYTSGGRTWGLFSGSPAVGYFKIRDNTANLDRFVIDTSGNVGIGTTTPASRLDITNSATSSPIITLRDVIGNVSMEIRAGTSTLNNTFVGRGAGNANTTGNANTANGFNTLYSNTTGYQNTATGYQALNANTTGYFNTAYGLHALRYNISGNSNTANGVNALYYNTTGYQNTANGMQTLQGNTEGYNNTANGFQALVTNTTGYNNTANGAYALYANSTGFYNTANGMNALFSNTTGYYNTANGFQALQSNSTGIYNTANGVQALRFNTTGSSNTANGVNALYSNTTGSSNTANGFQALFSNTTGSSNTANGMQALNANTTGYQNTANGLNALYNNTTGYSNTATGYQALLSNTTGYDNTATGMFALYSNTTGINNTANGVNALSSNNTGNYNTANGFNALRNNTTGYNNTANGFQTLYSNTTGYSNTANGMQALLVDEKALFFCIHCELAILTFFAEVF